jgi:hypothetical protein
MKVTDLFAAAAMLGLIIRNEKSKNPEQRDEEWIAYLAYEYVDYMLESKIVFEQEWMNVYKIKKDRG